MLHRIVLLNILLQKHNSYFFHGNHLSQLRSFTSKAYCRCIGYHVSTYPPCHQMIYLTIPAQQNGLSLRSLRRFLDLSRTFDDLYPGLYPSTIHHCEDNMHYLPINQDYSQVDSHLVQLNTSQQYHQSPNEGNSETFRSKVT